MDPQVLFLAVTPAQAGPAGRRGLPLAHLAYQVGPGLHLFRANFPTAPQGGLLVVEDGRFSGTGEAEPFCSEVLRECAARRVTGVFCRFGPGGGEALGRAVERLAGLCRDRGLACYVTEPWALRAGEARVVISTALSGGSLRGRLEEAVGRFGPGRTAVWLERSAEDFTLPAPTGSGRPLSGEELERLLAGRGGSSFFSPELCARYFTYMAGQTGHFVLFDDGPSLRRKLELSRGVGIPTAFLPYGAAEDCLAEVLG